MDHSNEKAPRPVGFRRDASWHPCPNVSAPKRVHRVGDGDKALAACSNRIVLNDSSPVDLLSLPHIDSLCRRCFPRAASETSVARMLVQDAQDRTRPGKS